MLIKHRHKLCVQAFLFEVHVVWTSIPAHYTVHTVTHMCIKIVKHFFTLSCVLRSVDHLPKILSKTLQIPPGSWFLCVYMRAYVWDRGHVCADVLTEGRSGLHGVQGVSLLQSRSAEINMNLSLTHTPKTSHPS